MERFAIEENYTGDELEVQLKPEINENNTLSDIHNIEGVREVNQLISDHPVPLLRLIYLLKVQPNLRDVIFDKLKDHPGVQWVDLVAKRDLVGRRYYPD